LIERASSRDEYHSINSAMPVRTRDPLDFGQGRHFASPEERLCSGLRPIGVSPAIVFGDRVSINNGQSTISPIPIRYIDLRMKNESQVIVRPARNVRGSVELPGDKSISHRYAMLAGIAEGASRLGNYSTGADCASTLGCMRSLGVEWNCGSDNSVEVKGRGLMLAEPAGALDCGNSGSTMRMLSGIVAGQKFASEMVGDESLSRRPMERVIKPLSAMGAHIASHGGKPPLRISGADLKAIDYKMPVASAQVKSCLMFAGLFAEGETRIEEPGAGK